MGTKRKRKKPAHVVRRQTRRQLAWVELIHERIYNNTFPTVRELAAELRCSPRSVKRDIRSLKYDWGMPVEYSRKAGQVGYYYSHPVSRKLALTINEQELIQMVLSDRGMSQYPVKKTQKHLGVAFDKIAQLAKSDMVEMISTVQDSFEFRPFAPETIDVNHLLMVADSIRAGKAIRFQYTKHLAESPEWKFINVYRIICAANSWYFIGYDREKDAQRTYLLSRAEDIQITDVTFEKPKFCLKKYLKGAFIVMTGDESHDVVVEFEPWAAAYIRNRTFTSDQKVEELPNGRLRISFWLSYLGEVEMWVRHWGKNALVIGPEPLRERMLSYGDWLGGKYGPRVG
ncbi:MAG: transcriptional regulator [Verrucomicrobia bacterium]|nr:transcriptional regulator [Verrucomicrobiota bacterium]